MRIAGLLAFIIGAAVAGWLVKASVEKLGWRGALAGLGAPVAVLVALAGALLLFVPDFFS